MEWFAKSWKRFGSPFVLAATLLASRPILGNPLPSERPSPATATPTTLSFAGRELPPEFQRLATALVRENLPEEHHDTRHWGMTDQRWNGLHLRLDGLEVRTKRKWKTVPHGTWKRYLVRPIDPETTLQVHLSPARQLPDGRSAVTVQLEGQIHGLTQWVQWNKGVRLWSVTAEGDATVRITLECNLDVQLDLKRLPPDLVLSPEVSDVRVELTEFKLQRLGSFDGPLIEELGNMLHQIVQEKLDEKRPSLVAKMNRQIVKHADDLRISPQQTWQTHITPWLKSPGGSVEAK